MKRVYQFKITMKEIAPDIWRRILVSEKYSFWDLHVAIQDAMGWEDTHLHLFRIRRKHAREVEEIGIPDPEGGGIFKGVPEILPGWETPISDYFNDLGISAEYEYDFGDCWRHEILFEGVLLWEKGRKYPGCIDGARACPPEDCGGAPGYERLLEIVADPAHEEYEDMLNWIGEGFDPEAFDCMKVKFDNPQKRWNNVFG